MYNYITKTQNINKTARLYYSYLPTSWRTGPQSMLVDPLEFSAVIVKVYSLPATRFDTMAVVTSAFAMSTSVGGLIARPSSN